MFSKKPGLVIGPVLFVIVLFLPIDGIAYEAKIVLAITALMAVWWITETVPLFVTSLIPIVLFPIFSVQNVSETALYYVDKVVILFLGGFVIAIAVERSNLHKRIALNILQLFGAKSHHVIGGFILVTGCLSAWMSNTATAILMLPIAMALISRVDENSRKNFAVCLVVCVAYAASLGGVATIIGTPPNAVLVSISEKMTSVDVDFGKWMLIGVPISAVSLIVLWVYITRLSRLENFVIGGSVKIIKEEIRELGELSKQEKIVLAVFLSTAAAWVSRGLVWKEYLPFIEDHTIAIISAVILILTWIKKTDQSANLKIASKIQWKVLILIGGGLALAGGFTATGLDVWISSQLGFVSSLSLFLVIMVVVAITIFSGEIMSNTAGAALLIPVMASLSTTLDVPPLLLMMPVAIATSFSFIMPVGTPPNAIAIGSGQVTPKQMARIGLPLNIIGVFLVTIMTFLLIPIVWP